MTGALRPCATRERVVAVALTWIGTPYVSNALVKGAGVDCAMLLVGVFREAGMLDPEFDPRPYPPQWHLHRGEERFLHIVERLAVEVDREPKSGDILLFRLGRLYAHGAVVLSWPEVIHAWGQSQQVTAVNVTQNCIGKHALGNLPRRVFSPWGD
jgi:NlpC/P60 family putative phage cell wall peptidase